MKRNDSTGVSLVEFALVIPFLLLIIFGLFDLGWGVYANNTIALGAREGARKGIISSVSDAAIRDRVRSTAAGLELPDENIEISRNPSGGNMYITVTVRYDFTPFTPLIGSFIPGGHITLTGISTMYIEG